METWESIVDDVADSDGLIRRGNVRGGTESKPSNCEMILIWEEEMDRDRDFPFRSWLFVEDKDTGLFLPGEHCFGMPVVVQPNKKKKHQERTSIRENPFDGPDNSTREPFSQEHS